MEQQRTIGGRTVAQTVLFASLVNWLITYILVEGSIFQTPRRWAKRHAPDKLAELATCQLCAGVWVGFGQGLLIRGPLGHFILDGLLYKAGGHLVLEVASLLRHSVGILAAYRKTVDTGYAYEVGGGARATAMSGGPSLEA
jgi:hypothetical protein